MSRECERLETQLRLALEGEAWHGPALLEVLQDVTPDEAHAHPIVSVHSIWEIVLHLAATYGVVLQRLEGKSGSLTPEEDWPAVSSPTASNWRHAITSLEKLNGQLRHAVARFNPDNLDKPLIAEPSYSAYTQFIGITQHDLYHAGQIAILKKALRG